MVVQVNALELAEILASADTVEHFRNTLLNPPIMVTEENGDRRYTEEAQDYFNDKYDYYFEIITNTAEKL